MRRLILTAVPLVLVSGPAWAQEIWVWRVTVSTPGGYAEAPSPPASAEQDSRVDRKRVPVSASSSGRASAVAASPSSSVRCSPDAMPPSERRRIQTEYTRRLRADGQARANAWAAEQGRRFRLKLVSQGVCPPLPGQVQARPTPAPVSASRKPVRDRNGRVCTKTRLENRNVANPGGGARSMILVPVCAD